jgi:hypothetical protein
VTAHDRPADDGVSAGPLDVETLTLSARRWAGLGEVLTEIAARIGRFSQQVGDDWPDGHGAEWAERVALLGQAIGREARAAGELGAAYARQAADVLSRGSVPPLRPGMRLGSIEAQRVDGQRGIRVAQLPADGIDLADRTG